MRYVILCWERSPIHSKHVDLLFHRGSTHNVSYVLIASVEVMALVLLMNRGLFVAGNIISLALPTNLLIMDGLKRRNKRGFLSHFMGFNLLSFCCFLFFLEAHFGRQFSWLKFTSLCLPFLFLLVDCYMVHCPSFALLAYL